MQTLWDSQRHCRVLWPCHELMGEPRSTEAMPLALCCCVESVTLARGRRGLTAQLNLNPGPELGRRV